jgi:hypothetical protein
MNNHCTHESLLFFPSTYASGPFLRQKIRHTWKGGIHGRYTVSRQVNANLIQARLEERFSTGSPLTTLIVSIFIFRHNELKALAPGLLTAQLSKNGCKTKGECSTVLDPVYISDLKCPNA